MQLSNELIFVEISSVISEKKMRIEKVGLVGYVTYMVISPEPAVFAIFHLKWICGRIVAFNRA